MMAHLRFVLLKTYRREDMMVPIEEVEWDLTRDDYEDLVKYLEGKFGSGRQV